MGTCYSKKKKKSASFKDDDLPFRSPYFQSAASIQSLFQQHRVLGPVDGQGTVPDVSIVTAFNKNDWDTEDSFYEDIDNTTDDLQPVKLQVELPWQPEQKPPPRTSSELGLTVSMVSLRENIQPSLPSRYSCWRPNKTNAPPDTSLRHQTNGGAEGFSELAVSHNYKLVDEHMKYMEYSEMIQIFKPLIVQNLLIHDILPYLPFLDNHNEFYEEMKHRSQKTAVVSLLAEIEKSEEPRKWQIFMDALKTSGYMSIVDTIRGYIFINHRKQAEYIKRLTPVIGKMISPPELMPYLMANELLSDTDKDNILCECNNRGDYAGAVLLLDRITRKHGNWYMLFIKALEEANCHEVAAKLRITGLMENGRCKDKDGDGKYEEIDIYGESQNVTVPTVINTREPPPQAAFDLTDFFEETREYKYENQDIEAHHKVFGSPSLPPCPRTKKAPIPTPRNKHVYYLTPMFVDGLDKIDVKASIERGECETMFSDVSKEVKNLEQEKLRIKEENSLLEKKLVLNDEVINILKKRRELLDSLSEKEQERKELHQAPVVDKENPDYHDNLVTNGNTSLPREPLSTDKEKREIRDIHDKQDTNESISLLEEQLAMVDVLDTLIDIPRPHTELVRNRGNILLPIYTPNYDKKAFLLPPQDSGFGTASFCSDFNFTESY